MLSQYFVDELKVDIFVVFCNLYVLDIVCYQVFFVLIDYLVGLLLDELSYQVLIGGISFLIVLNNGLYVSVNGFIQWMLQLLIFLVEGYFSFMLIKERLV